MRKTIAAAGVTAALLTGGAAGVALFTPSVTGAQEAEAPETVDPESPDAAEQDGPRGCHGRHHRGLAEAADAIGIDVEALRDALRDGQTIADVAESNDVDVQDVIDALVAARTEKIEQAVADEKLTQDEADERLADLEQKVTDLVNGDLERPEGFRGPRGPRGGPDDGPAEDTDTLFAA